MENEGKIFQKSHIVIMMVALMVFVISMAPVFGAAQDSYENWEAVATDMDKELDAAKDAYANGDASEATKRVNEAYYSYYEAVGFERNTMTHISGSRGSDVELQFTFIKKNINDGKSVSEVNESIDKLSEMLHEDAAKLDGTEGESGGGFWGSFIGSLVIILREGFEAILIVGAIIAYLIKSGNRDKNKAVYIGCLIAIAASFVMAWILNMLSGANGAKQEIIEGVTALLAVVVLFFTSNWMVSKAESEAWSHYIQGKVQGSMTSGNVFSLAFVAFLAVFREGAEVVLFYQALLVGADDTKPVWIGFLIGAVALIFVYLLIRFASLRIPLKPFFLGTSILMFLMSVSFIGAGIKELQEGNVLGGTQISGIPTIDVLGIYPTVETIVPQIILLLIAAATFYFHVNKNRKLKAEETNANED